MPATDTGIATIFVRRMGDAYVARCVGVKATSSSTSGAKWAALRQASKVHGMPEGRITLVETNPCLFHATVAAPLTTDEVAALRVIKTGCTVWSPAMARILMSLKTTRPGLLTLTPTPVEADGSKAYFGAIITGQGKSALDAHEAAKKARGAR